MAANPYARTLRKASDPLKEETRRVRKTLLIWCLASVAVTSGKLFPTEVTALGMKVTATSHAFLLMLLALIIAYHLIAFGVYASSDFAHWYVDHFSTQWEDDVAVYESYKSELLAKTKLSDDDRQFIEEHERRLGAIWRAEPSNIFIRVERAVPFISIARALVDFLLPMAVGAGALYIIIKGYATTL